VQNSSGPILGLVTVVAVLAVSVVSAEERPAQIAHEPHPVFTAVTPDAEAPQYTGERISLSLKEADVKDVLKTFSALTGLNIVVEPVVKGSVTVELHDVPWDQAFEIILQINGLAFTRHRNVVVVASRSRLDRFLR